MERRRRGGEREEAMEKAKRSLTLDLACVIGTIRVRFRVRVRCLCNRNNWPWLCNRNEWEGLTRTTLEEQ